MRLSIIGSLLLLLPQLAIAQTQPQFSISNGTLSVTDPSTGSTAPIGNINGSVFDLAPGGAGSFGTPTIQSVQISTVPNTIVVHAKAYEGALPASSAMTVGYQFEAYQDYGSFGDNVTHTGFLVTGGKSNSTSDTTGNWNLFTTQYEGYAGATANSFITAGQAFVHPKHSEFNNRGNWTGWNPVCRAEAGMSPDACIAEEDDVATFVAPRNVRQGLRISDAGSAANSYGMVTDSALGLVKFPATAAGFKAGILFGDVGLVDTFPIATGGSLVSTAPSSVALNAFVDLSKLSGAPATAALYLPANIREMCFGPNCGGGSVLSTSTTNGGTLAFEDNLFVLAFTTPIFNINNLGDANLIGGLRAAAFSATPQTPATSSSPCRPGDFLTDANYIYVCASTNTWKRAALSSF